MTVFQQLREKGKLAAIHDSSARAYPPRCHTSTRQTLRSRIVRWGTGDENDERMYWVLGPPAVGKSAVAQTIAEEFEKKGRLGASFFFSRRNHLDDPDWVIPTLAYQLATKHPQYKRIITQRLVDDPSILEKNREVQFEKLVIEPFRILMIKYPHTIEEPLLIILDGLDECKDKQAQCELIKLINTHVRQVDDFPLRWMICSRPEWHLNAILSDADGLIVYEHEELRVDDKEAREDAERLLEAGFGKIRREYRLPNDWPPERHLQYITFTASGHLGFVSFILRFVGNEEYDDPDGQLQICMKFLGGGTTVGVSNPLRALDLLYRQILSNVPHNRLPTTMRILAFVILYNRHYYGLDSSDNQARFLNLDPATFYQSLRNLHSVVYVPPMDKSSADPLRIYHASFSDFLMDPSRSGKYWLNERAANYDFALQCLHWLENDGKDTT
ncbi:hypothetical protein P691DRAFT_674487 [Macrolepiota fuliginosa MF-IS2]|uniref:Nephrocystin 3-like N-terminal domain-containing protein n=1 Tax=Macrolepiota fuliginosa MF-IS2 TaxID=1400762 RepID=A0A9P6BZZ2_9AGAR|nr:hypothetical protein P691DRAFT_674487 [Macrolepiota fuliginosa MF-IS2]